MEELPYLHAVKISSLRQACFCCMLLAQPPAGLSASCPPARSVATQIGAGSASTGCLNQHHTVLAPAVANADLLILCCSRPSSVPVAAKARARCSSDSDARGRMCLKKGVKVAPPWGS